MKKLISLMCVAAVLVTLAVVTGGCDPALSGKQPASARVRIVKSVKKLVDKINPDETYSQKEIFAMMEETLNENPDIFGAAWAIPKNGGKNADIYYIYRDEHTFVTRTDKDMDTASPLLAWFRKPYRSGRGGWSHPYNVEDAFGNRLSLVTYCSLVRKQRQAPSAIIACDYLIHKTGSPSSSTVQIDSPSKE